MSGVPDPSGAPARSASRSTSVSGHGGRNQLFTPVSIADEEVIFLYLDWFCLRLRHLLDILHTLEQYHLYALAT